MDFLKQLEEIIKRSNPDKLVIKQLDIHNTQVCNFSCSFCSHYSNFKFKESITPQILDEWLKAAAKVFVPVRFNIVGGEPTVHKQLLDFYPVIRKHYPLSLIRLITNGSLLHRHPKLPEVMNQYQPCDIALSIHHTSDEYQEFMKEPIKLLTSWKEKYNITVVPKESYSYWTRKYELDENGEPIPYEDGNPRASWENCFSRDCTQIHDGKVYKCAPFAQLSVLARNKSLSKKWDKYLAFDGLDVNTLTKKELERILNNEEDICGMCPIKEPRIEKDFPF